MVFVLDVLYFFDFLGGGIKIKKNSIGIKKHAKTEYIEYICAKP
jgi:hypothetical protein